MAYDPDVDPYCPFHGDQPTTYERCTCAKPPASVPDEAAMRVLFMFLGTVDGMHEKLDLLRDETGTPGKASAVDHNIEQAQIALETCSMRLQQVATIVRSRMDADSKEKADD